jgi:hypothetical protein
VESGKVNGEHEKGRIRCRYFIYLYENRAMKFVEIILSRRKGERENDDGENLTKEHHQHIWKCENEILLYN